MIEVKKHIHVETQHMEDYQSISAVLAAQTQNTKKKPQTRKHATVEIGMSRIAQINRYKGMRDQQKATRVADPNASQQ